VIQKKHTVFCSNGNKILGWGFIRLALLGWTLVVGGVGHYNKIAQFNKRETCGNFKPTIVGQLFPFLMRQLELVETRQLELVETR
jgi:hypothetical protein